MTDREEALLWLNSFVKNKEPMTLIPKQLIRLMYDALKEQEAVVRCRDCKYGTEMSGNIICHKPKHDEYETDIRPFDWFCADGERRET